MSPHPLRQYLSLILLFAPGVFMAAGLWWFRDHPRLALTAGFPFFPWQFWVLGGAGVVATIGGVLDWRFHRDPLKLQLSKKERDAEAAAVYAAAYSRDPEFYAFTRSLKAYENAFDGTQDLMVLDPRSDFFRYLKESHGKR